jgi:hypothetical protein
MSREICNEMSDNDAASNDEYDGTDTESDANSVGTHTESESDDNNSVDLSNEPER